MAYLPWSRTAFNNLMVGAVPSAYRPSNQSYPLPYNQPQNPLQQNAYYPYQVPPSNAPQYQNPLQNAPGAFGYPSPSQGYPEAQKIKFKIKPNEVNYYAAIFASIRSFQILSNYLTNELITVDEFSNVEQNLKSKFKAATDYIKADKSKILAFCNSSPILSNIEPIIDMLFQRETAATDHGMNRMLGLEIQDIFHQLSEMVTSGVGFLPSKSILDCINCLKSQLYKIGFLKRNDSNDQILAKWESTIKGGEILNQSMADVIRESIGKMYEDFGHYFTKSK